MSYTTNIHIKNNNVLFIWSKIMYCTDQILTQSK